MGNTDWTEAEVSDFRIAVLFPPDYQTKHQDAIVKGIGWQVGGRAGAGWPTPSVFPGRNGILEIIICYLDHRGMLAKGIRPYRVICPGEPFSVADQIKHDLWSNWEAPKNLTVRVHLLPDCQEPLETLAASVDQLPLNHVIITSG